MDRADFRQQQECEEMEWTEAMQDAYAEFLMAKRGPDLMICNGDDLLRAMEQETMIDEFIREQRQWKQ